MTGPHGMVLWIIGPQLIGAITLFIGWIQKTWPPKKINNLYGYRTTSAMKNQETWDEANRYSAILMMKAGVVLVITGIIISAITNVVPMDKKIRAIITVMPCIAAGMASAIITMVKTEKHLAKTFNSEKG